MNELLNLESLLDLHRRVRGKTGSVLATAIDEATPKVVIDIKPFAEVGITEAAHPLKQFRWSSVPEKSPVRRSALLSSLPVSIRHDFDLPYNLVACVEKAQDRSPVTPCVSASNVTRNKPVVFRPLGVPDEYLCVA
jgi:hypothetical protein